jgi:hypothetical protein
MYVLKEWEREYQKSKDELFSDFHNLSPRWSKVMCDNFGADGANRSLELGELISKNLHTRMSPFEFENEILGIIVDDINSDELRRVLQGEKYLSNDKLQSENLSPGDVFKKKGKYYLNIRAGCDLIPDRSTAVTSLDDVELYLIGGNKLTVDKEQEHFLHSHGAFSEKDSQAIVFPIDDYCTVDFRFKRLKIVKWSDWKTRRIGRLLPPYINRIQQRFGLFVQRQALPRTPSSSLDRS